jgi:hypothetical protein
VADIKISAAADIVTVVGTDMVPVARSGSTSAYHATMAEMATFAATVAPVTSWNTRTGAVVLTSGDVTTALTYTPYNATNPSGYQTAANVTTALVPYAPLASPTFTGTPTLPTGAVGVTQTKGNNTTALATTAFVLANAGAGGASITVSDTPPGSPTSGAMWWDSAGGQLYLWYVDANSSQWVAASSQAAGIGDAPNDANTYGRHANGWTQAATPASVTAAVAPAFNDVGRNLLHNALFNVAQRGNGPWTTSTYTADRWHLVFASDTNSVTLASLTDTDRAGIGDETASLALQNVFTGNAAAGALTVFYQPIENVLRLSGRTVTVSFWARRVAGTAPALGVSIDQVFGTGGSPSAGTANNGMSVAITATWARYSLTFAIASAAGKVLGTNGDHSTQLNFWYSSGATNNPRAGNIGVQSGTIQLWGIQLEVGSVATPLEKPDPQQDLAKCQRFYQVGTMSLSGYNAAGAGVAVTMPLPVAMRAAPTITPTVTTNINCAAGGIDSISAGYYRPNTTATALGAMAWAGTFTASADL